MPRFRFHPAIFALLLAVLLAPGCAMLGTWTVYGFSDEATGADLELLREQSAPYRQRGAGVIVGRAFLTFPENKEVRAYRGLVRMVPATHFAEGRLDKYVIKKNEFPPEIQAQVKWSTRTDTDGKFVFRELPPGTYLIASEIAYVNHRDKAAVAIVWAEVTIGEGETKPVYLTRKIARAPLAD